MKFKAEIYRVVEALTRLMKEERRHLAEHSLINLVEATRRKNELLAEFEQLSNALQDGAPVEDLARQLEDLKERAEDNGRQYEALLAGVRRAREALARLETKEKSGGAYRQDGGSIRANTEARLNTRF